MDEGKGEIPDYGYVNGESAQAHSYLFPVLEGILKTVVARRVKCKDIRIFDAGCGNGAMVGRLAALGYDVIGCDASETGIREAQKKFPQIKFETASVYDDLAARYGSEWDVVISSEVIEHLYFPRRFVNNAFNLIKPGGLLIITTPYHGYWKNVVLAISGKLDSHFSALWEGGHIKFWSYKTLKILMGETGFVDFNFVGAGRMPFLWKSMVVTARKPAT